MVPCKSTAEEVSFEWSHHRISSTDSKVGITLHVSLIDFGNERVIQIGSQPLNLTQNKNEDCFLNRSFSWSFNED